MRKLTIMGAALVAALVLAAPASASSYLSKPEAKAATRQAVRVQYAGLGLHRISIRCHPQYGERYRPGWVYPRWACSWAATDYEGDIVFGKMRIVGAPGDRFTYKPVVGIHWL